MVKIKCKRKDNTNGVMCAAFVFLSKHEEFVMRSLSWNMEHMTLGGSDFIPQIQNGNNQGNYMNFEEILR